MRSTQKKNPNLHEVNLDLNKQKLNSVLIGINLHCHVKMSY